MLNLLFPTYCINCGRMGDYLCPLCIKKLKNNLPECYICRKVSNGYITHKECNRYAVDKVFVAWEYGDIPKKILSQYKYRYAYKISKILSTLLITRLDKTNFSKNISPKTILIPIPIHSSHEKERGFNQSSLLAHTLSKHYECKVNDSILRRIGDNRYQSQQNLNDRINLNENIFKKHKEMKGEDIILIDDVLSTGTTLNRACTTLAGNHISAITLFRGKPHYQYLRK